jgi:geranylgeranyl diphosphate synthase type II
LPKENEHPASLSKAMRYAVLSGGKRIRPIFALAACEAVGGKAVQVMEAACALEFIHSYSLVHDDLPCMDDDAMRRGQPSCHAKFGEVTALLAGDALLTQAFKILSSSGKNPDPKSIKKRLQAIHWLSEAIGHQGMVGGQALDMEYQDKEIDLPTIEYINTHKSGALIAVSTKIGAFLGGGTPQQVEALYRYGKYVGLLFQIVDDIMDQQGYTQVIGSHEAQEEAVELLSKAKRELSFFGPKGLRLKQIADFVVSRKN